MKDQIINLSPGSNHIELIRKPRIDQIQVKCEGNVALRLEKSGRFSEPIIEKWKGSDGDVLRQELHYFFIIWRDNYTRLCIKSSSHCSLSVSFAEKKIYDPTVRKHIPKNEYWAPNEVEARERRLAIMKVMEKKLAQYKSNFYRCYYRQVVLGAQSIKIFNNDVLLNPVYLEDDKIWDVPEFVNRSKATLTCTKDVLKVIPRRGDYTSYLKIEEGSPSVCKVLIHGRKHFEIKISPEVEEYPFILLCCCGCFSETGLEFDSDTTVTLQHRNLPGEIHSIAGSSRVAIQQYNVTQLYENGMIRVVDI